MVLVWRITGDSPNFPAIPTAAQAYRFRIIKAFNKLVDFYSYPHFRNQLFQAVRTRCYSNQSIQSFSIHFVFYVPYSDLVHQ